MGFLSFLPLSALLLVMLADRNMIKAKGVINNFPCGYDYSSEGDGWFKLHTEGASLSDAQFYCFMERAELVSPTSFATIKAMMFQMVIAYDKYELSARDSIYVHTAINASELNLEDWFEPFTISSLNNLISVAVSETGKLQIVSRYAKLPYICYKKANNILQFNECVTGDPLYKLDKRTNNCYKFHRDQTTWSNAAEICSTEGGYLAIINSEEESNVMKDLFAANAKYDMDINTNNGHSDAAFIGFLAERDGVWRTLEGKTLSEAGFATWTEKREPTLLKDHEYCGTVGPNGELYEGICGSKRVFICEKEIITESDECTE